MSLIVLALYFWAYFADVKSISAALLVKDSAAIAAAASLLVSFVSYLWAPKKYTFWGAYTAFVLLCITTAILLISTGGTTSPFLALWMAVSVFAGVFGIYGLSPLFIAIVSYLAIQFLGGAPGEEVLVAIVLAGFLPLILSYLLWHNKSADQKSSDQAYHELATELSEVAGKSEVVINAIGDGVIALDNKGIIQLINPAAQQIIGWGKQDALSLDYKSVLKLVDNNDADVVPANDPVAEVLATNQEVTTNNLKLLTNAGKKRLVSVVVSPIGQLGAGVIIVFRDITKEKAEEREQAEFISTASHEMRTPVASIEGYLGLALNPATAQIDEKARDFINKAHESAQHLGHLFQDLLDVTKADDGRMSNNPKVVDVVEFTHTITQGLRPKAEEKGLRVLFKPQPDDDEDDKKGERRISPVYYANVDNDHLREIIANLVENAIKYTPKGEVVIDVNGDNDHIVISIADSGIGIPKEDQAHLFQKFYRVDNSDTREIGGTGLGLYLCRRLAEGMSGRIWVESEYKRGSTFYLEIPRIDHEEAMRLIESAETKQNQEISDVTVQSTIEKPTLTPLSATEPTTQTNIVPATPLNTPDTTYTNIPAQAVAQQLQNINAAPATTQQTATPIPTPITQTYQPPQAPQYYSTPAAPAPTSQPPQASYIPTRPIIDKPNTPLASIEQHPDQYLRPRTGVAIPPRRQE